MNPKDDTTSIGSILLNMGVITREQLDVAVRTQRCLHTDTLLGVLLVHEGYCTKEELEEAIDTQISMRNGHKANRAIAFANFAMRKSRDSGVYKCILERADSIARKVETGDFPNVLIGKSPLCNKDGR